MLKKNTLALAGFMALAVCGTSHAEDQSSVVFFTDWSALVDDSAQTVIQHAADLAKEHPDNTVNVEGFADTKGGDKVNELLSETRAQMVSDELVKAGVPESRIKVSAHGSVAAAGQSDISKVESRRVVISLQAP